MNEISKLFDQRSLKYKVIYELSSSKNLLHQEKVLRAALVKKFIMQISSLKEEEIIIDVGCGIGNVLLNLKANGIKAEMYGLDISKNMIDFAKKNLDLSGFKNIYFINDSITDNLKPANIVLSLGVIGYQKKQEDFIKNLSNLVIEDGYFIFTTANGDSLLRKLRMIISKSYGFFKKKTKNKRVEFLPIKNIQVMNILNNEFEIKKKFYITFGLGLFSSSIECLIDRFFFKYLNNSKIGKYFSLSVIYIFKKSSKK